MKLWSHLAARVLGWVGLALALLVGLAGLAGVVEGIRWGPGTALTLAALEALPVVVPLVPVACAIGAGIAAARLQILGEAVALEAVGLAPATVALVAAAVGLGVGLATWGLHAGAVPPAAQHALQLRIDLDNAAAPAGWLWTGQDAVRTSDGARVVAADGRILSVEAGVGPPQPELVRQARALRQPVVAGLTELALDARPLRVERAVRVARGLACALLAALAWLGPAARRTSRVGPALALGLGWQALAMACAALAAGGQISVWLGAGGPVLALLLLLGLRLRA